MHASQPVAFVPLWNFPASHGLHAAFLVMFEKLPAMHGVGLVLPAAQKCPTGHGVHSESEAKLVALEYVPAEHTSAADAPCGQKRPISHTLQLV